jgi:hypothetical protein
MALFNLKQMRTAGRKKIKDRGITWKEVYKDKSKSLKKRFDRDIGPGRLPQVRRSRRDD